MVKLINECKLSGVGYSVEREGILVEIRMTSKVKVKYRYEG